MKKYNLKRKMAAALCAAMLLTQTAPVMPALHSTAYAEGEGETTQKVFHGGSASGHNATYDTSSDGSISGSATFSGSTVVAKLYKNGSYTDERTLPDGGGSFTFSGLSAGSYAVKYFFWNEGGTVLGENSVTVGYDDVEEPEETQSPDPQETETPAPNPNPEQTESPAPNPTETDDPDDQQGGGDDNNNNDNSNNNDNVNAGGNGNNLNSGTLFSVQKNAVTPEITDRTCNKTNETEAGKDDGTISGKVEFTGDTKVVVKLRGTSREAILSSSGETYTFDNLAPGSYTVDFHLYDQAASYSEVVEIAAASLPPKITAYSCHESHETVAGKGDGKLTGVVEFDGDLTVIVKLHKDGDATALKETSVTTSGGGYSFTDLKPGAYRVYFHLFNHESSYDVPVAINAGAVEQVIKDYTCLKTDVSGDTYGTISGTVTYSGDGPVTVTLSANGSDVDTYTVANSGDLYQFTGLPAGTYQIKISMPDDADVRTQTVEIGTAQTPSTEQITNYTCQKTDESEAGKNDGKISGIVEFTGSRAVVKLYEEGSTTWDEVILDNSGDSYEFTGLSAGKYQIAFHMYDQSASDTKTIEIIAAPVTAKIVSYVCLHTDLTAEGKNDGTITGSVTFTGDTPVVVKLYNEGGTQSLEEAELHATGDDYAFTNLPAGKYRVDYHLYNQSASKTETVEVGVAAPAVSPIAITSVKEGEKTLTVKGTAQAGETIKVETVPATPAAAMQVGTSGAFEWVLAADPNTYTQVKIYYANNPANADTETGSWKVTAPMTAPTITVDPVTNHSTTVVVQTGANLTVLLTVPDGTLTAQSNASGIAHFSLTHKYLKGEEFTITVPYGSGIGQIVTKKVTVEGAVDYNDLEYGDYGEAVLRLTTRLNQLGYPIAPTKDYNSAVREAVRLFQIANGQEADGEAGDRMQSALFSVSAIRYGSGRYPTLVRGDSGLALIKTLQQRLKDLGYYTIKVDGIFGSGTQRAVRLFQQVNGLPDTGIADNATQVLLYSSAAKPLGYAPSDGYSTLQRSSKYKSAVVTLQRRLRELGYYSGSIDGYFGSKTYRAVRNFQSRNGLSVTGVADAYTQQLLYSSAAKKYNGSSAGSSSSSSTGYRLLYWGCRGAEVTRLQNALISAGYKKYVRSADGIYGQWTYDAVCAYQRDHGLTVDGIAGKKTQNKLYGTNY